MIHVKVAKSAANHSVQVANSWFLEFKVIFLNVTQNDFVVKSFKIHFFKGTEKTREFEAYFVNKGDFKKC